MNNKIVTLFIATFIALIVLWAYTIGPLAGTRKPQANPISYQPVPQQQNLSAQGISFDAYHNKDLSENYYTISFPSMWRLQQGGQPGSYKLTFDNGNASAELMDVPDNSTLELFVLSQEEPVLKKTVPGYQRIDYKKISVNGYDAYQLTYGSSHGDSTNETVRTYIAGVDHTSVITFEITQAKFADTQSLFLDVLNSFHWENK